MMETVTSESRSKQFPGDGAGSPNGQVTSSSIGRLGLESAFRGEMQPQAARPAGFGFVTEGSNPQIRDALAESDLFGALADDDLDQLIERGRVVTYRSGAVVFRKGDPAQDLMLVLCGCIRLSSASPNGKEVLFDFIDPGHCFGEVALLDGRMRKLDATAVKASAVFALRPRDVLTCLERHPAVAVRIIRVLCGRLSRAMEMFEERTQLGLPPRVARALLRLAMEHGRRDGNAMRISLKISQGEIAALIGATREKVNRQLCAWCREGVLAVDEGHLMILDQTALRAIAEEDCSS